MTKASVCTVCTQFCLQKLAHSGTMKHVHPKNKLQQGSLASLNESSPWLGSWPVMSERSRLRLGSSTSKPTQYRHRAIESSNMTRHYLDLRLKTRRQLDADRDAHDEPRHQDPRRNTEPAKASNTKRIVSFMVPASKRAR